MAIGFAVDYSAHIAHSFMIQTYHFLHNAPVSPIFSPLQRYSRWASSESIALYGYLRDLWRHEHLHWHLCADFLQRMSIFHLSTHFALILSDFSVVWNLFHLLQNVLWHDYFWLAPRHCPPPCRVVLHWTCFFQRRCASPNSLLPLLLGFSRLPRWRRSFMLDPPRQALRLVSPPKRWRTRMTMKTMKMSRMSRIPRV